MEDIIALAEADVSNSDADDACTDGSVEAVAGKDDRRYPPPPPATAGTVAVA